MMLIKYVTALIVKTARTKNTIPSIYPLNHLPLEADFLLLKTPSFYTPCVFTNNIIYLEVYIIYGGKIRQGGKMVYYTVKDGCVSIVANYYPPQTYRIYRKS